LAFRNGLACIKKDNKWGWINKKGDLVIRAEFDDTRSFINNVALAKKGYKWGLIDVNGNFITPSLFDEIIIISESIIGVLIDYKWGVIDWAGNYIVNPKFNLIEPPINGLATIRDKGMGKINMNGDIVVQPKYDNTLVIWGDIVEVTVGNKKGLLDTLGRELLPCQYQLHRCGYRLYLLEQNGRYGLFAPDYGVRIEPAYEELGFVDEEFGWIRARKNGKWGWVDKTGKVKIPFRFDAAAPFKDGKARVLRLPYEETFYINEKGEMILGE